MHHAFGVLPNAFEQRPNLGLGIFELFGEGVPGYGRSQLGCGVGAIPIVPDALFCEERERLLHAPGDR